LIKGNKPMPNTTVDHKQLRGWVNALTPTNDHYDAALEICAVLYDGTQDPNDVLRTVIVAIDKRMDELEQSAKDGNHESTATTTKANRNRQMARTR
jgi:hypothetical protein